MSVTVFTFLILILYLAGTKVVSYFAYKKSRENTEDYFLASRGVGFFALVATTMASIFSTGTVVVAPSEFFTKGIGYFWTFLLILLPLLMMPMVLKFWALGKVKGYITPGHMLGDFYKSRSVQVIAGFMGLVSMIPYAATQMVAVGKIFDALTNGVVPYPVGVTIVCLAIGMYLWYGGSRAVIWTDMIQGVVFSLLLTGTAFLVVHWAGGWENVMVNLEENNPKKATFDVGLKYFEYIPMLISFFFLPYVWQRSYMSKSAAKLSLSVVMVAVIFVVLFIITWVIGTSALVLFPDGLKDGDMVLGKIFVDNAPYFGAFVLVAAFAAGMSTVDSQMLSAGSLLTHDLKNRLFGSGIMKRLKCDNDYMFARVSVLVLLFLIYVWSLTLQDKPLISLLLLGISVNVVFLVPVLGMFYWRRSTAAAAAISMVLSFITFVLKSLTPLGEYFPTPLGGVSWAVIVSLVVFMVVSLFTDSKRLDKSRAEYARILSV